MISRNNILSDVLFAIMLLIGFSSCISVDEFTPSADISGEIEFVVRPTSYNGQVVQTKATSLNDFENRIHNCYLLLFNGSGNRVFLSEDIAGLATYRISKSEIISKLGGNATCTACFIANVPKNVIDGLTTLSAVNSAVLDIDYSNVDVLDSDNDNKHSAFVVPEFDLDGSGSSTPIQCIPMFGMEECNLANADLFGITLKRLFAKVTINISVTSGSFNILASHMVNLPTSVRLAESGEESNWVKDPSAFLSQQIEGPIDETISNGIAGMLASSYEFFFYVPEYYLHPVSNTTANFGNEKYKPQMFDREKNPIYIRLFGTYNDTSSITYDLYLGEDAATSFTLKRNVHYMNSMIINGITNSKEGSGETLDCRVEVTTDQFDEVEILGQTANCYIIGQTGSYRYPACKGVFKGGVNNIPDDMKCTEGTTLKVLYNDNSSITIENLNYNNEANEFSFDVTSLDGGTAILASNDGNVILGLVYYDEDGVEKVEWSWHLWFQPGTSLDTDLGFFDFDASNQTYPNGYVMMDRNLGALPRSFEYPGVEVGAYYKYGHKEPYLGGAYRGGGESSSYNWSGDEKSVTDPCPPGYRVPPQNVWEAEANGEQPTKEHYKIPLLVEAFRFWGDFYYPYSGYVDANNNIQSAGYGTKPNYTTMPENKIPAEQDEVRTLTTWNYDTPLIFTNVKYRRYDINNIGISAARNSKQFEYFYTEKGTDIETCTIKIGEWKRVRIGRYTAQYSNTTETLTGEQLKSKYSTHYNRLISVLNGGDGGLDNLVLDALFSAPNVDYKLEDVESVSYGYQVRCVKE